MLPDAHQEHPARHTHTRMQRFIICRTIGSIEKKATAPLDTFSSAGKRCMHGECISKFEVPANQSRSRECTFEAEIQTENRVPPRLGCGSSSGFVRFSCCLQSTAFWWCHCGTGSNGVVCFLCFDCQSRVNTVKADLAETAC